MKRVPPLIFVSSAIVAIVGCGDRSTNEVAAPVDQVQPAETENAEGPETPLTEATEAAAERATAEVEPPPFRYGRVEPIAARDDPSFDNDPVAHYVMFRGEAARRPSGRIEAWMHTHGGQWGLVPMEDPPLEYEEVTLVTSHHTLCVAPVVRAQQFWGRLDDFSGSIQVATFLALSVDPESECSGHDAFAGAPVHEISLRHSDIRRARQSLVREVTPYDFPSYDDPREWDGTVRAIHLPRYDVVVISGQHLFVKRGEKLYSAEGYTRMWEADGHGLFFYVDSPSDPGVVTLDHAFHPGQEPLGPDDLEYCEENRRLAAERRGRDEAAEALLPGADTTPRPAPANPVSEDSPEGQGMGRSRTRLDPWAGTPPDRRPIGGG